MTNKDGKIAVVGDKDSILAFKAIGVDAFVADTPQDADETVKELTKEQYAVIFITEELASAIPSTLQKLKTRTYPAVIAIPSASGNAKGYARESFRKDVERAIGADILKDDG